MSSCEKSVPNHESDSGKKPPDEANNSIPVLIQRTTSNSEPCTNVMDMESYRNKTVKNQSWASNYLQSIGLSYDKTFLKRKPKIIQSPDDSNNLLPKVSIASNVNLTNNITNVGYNTMSCSTNNVEEIGASFVSYNNVAPTEVHAIMPAMAYANPYVNNNYYMEQAQGNSEYAIKYYNIATTPNTMINANFATTYPNTFDQSMNKSNIMYNSNENSLYSGINIPITYSDTYSNQSNNYYEQNVWTTTGFSNIDKSLQSGVCENSTCNESNALKSQNLSIKTQLTPSNEIKENKCCKCSCSKTNQEQSNEKETDITKKFEQVIQSKVQENEKRVIEFLEKINMKHQSESKNKMSINKDKSVKKTQKQKKHNISDDTPLSKKEHHKLPKKTDVYEEEPTRKKKKIEILAADKSRNKPHVDEREHKINKKRNEQQDEKLFPIFLKKKIVDKQDAAMSRKRKEVKFEQDEETRPKFIKTKYVDEQEPTYTSEHNPVKEAKVNNKNVCNYDNKHDMKPGNNFKVNNSKDGYQNLNPSRLESAIYCKYKPKDYYDSDKKPKTSPVRSMITVSKKSDLNKYSCLKRPENKDLRNILSRKLTKKEDIKKGREHETPIKKCSDPSNDNLTITVNNNFGNVEKSPEKTLDKSKSSCDTRKKLNLVINILYKQPSAQSESNESDSDDHSQQAPSDLSFLDEINVDEIVESLKKTEKIDIPSNSTDHPKLIQGDEILNGHSNLRNDLTIEEHSQIEKAKHVPSEDLLNDLILKEASLLDSLRLVHQKIESEKRNLDYYPTKRELFKNEFTHRDDKNIEFATTVSDNVTRTKSEQLSIQKNIGTESNKAPLILKNTEVQSQSLMHLFNSIKTAEPNNIINDVQLFNKQSLTSMCPSKEDMTAEEKGKQEYIQNKTKDESLISDDIIEVEDLNQSIIDLSSDDDDNIEKIKLAPTITREQPLLNPADERLRINDEIQESQHKQEKLQIIDTIDLTDCENKPISPLLNENTINEDIRATVINKHPIEEDSLQEIKSFLVNYDLNNKENETANTPICTKIVNVETKLMCNLREETTNEKNNPVEILQMQTKITKPSSTSTTLDDNCSIIKEIETDNISLRTFENVVNSECKIESKENTKGQPRVNIALESLSKDCNIIEVIEKEIESQSIKKCDVELDKHDLNSSKNKLNVHVLEEKDHLGLLNVAKSLNAKEAPEILNVDTLNQNFHMKEIMAAENDEKCVKEKKGADSDHNPAVQLNDKEKAKINDTKNKSNSNETNSVNNSESPKTEIQKHSKSDSFVTKDMPSVLKGPSTSSKKDESKVIAEIQKTKEDKTADIKKMDDNNMGPLKGPVLSIAKRIKHEMFKCFNKHFKMMNWVHVGTNSKIFHCKDTVGRDFAVKSLNHAVASYEDEELREMLFKFQESVTPSTNACVYFITSFNLNTRMCYLMEYYPKTLGTALAENAKPFHINVVQHLARQLVSAVMLLKGHDIVHLDIEPRHILLNHTNTKLKLCGFDEAKEVNNISRLRQVGSLCYRAPEMIIGYKLGFDIDVWATGLVLYEMATNIQLFPGFNCNEILFKQMCTLGAFPVEMIHRSRYSHVHFVGTSFRRVIGNANNISFRTKFIRSGRIETTISKAYNKYWRSNKQAMAEDLEKVRNLTALLNEMLQLNPVDRIPIQFVYEHPFLSNERY